MITSATDTSLNCLRGRRSGGPPRGGPEVCSTSAAVAEGSWPGGDEEATAAPAFMNRLSQIQAFRRVLRLRVRPVPGLRSLPPGGQGPGLKACSEGLYRSSNDRFPRTHESVQEGVRHRVWKKILALIGYARVSTEDQATFSQLDDLRAAGCQVVFEEKASGASRARPELARAVARVGRGDILVVARIDRLARSLVHLLEVIERVEAVGGHFKSLRDPIRSYVAVAMRNQGRFPTHVR